MREENGTIYSIKFISSIFVVFIHCMFPGAFGIFVKNIARYAVPVFLIISGYFWKSSDINREMAVSNSNRKIIKTLKLIAYSYSIYFVIFVVSQYLQGEILIMIDSFKSLKNWVYLFLFNYTTPFLGVGHLWYLFAIVYVYYIMRFITSNHIWKITYYLSGALLFVSFTIEIISFALELEVHSFIYRNWLFTALPLFSLGCFIKDKENRIKNIRLSILIFLYVFFIITETILLNDSFELMISSLIGCIIIMKIGISNTKLKKFSQYGKRYSTWIYLYHYIFVLIVGHFSIFSSNNVFLWIKPLFVTAVTLLFSIFVNGFCKRIYQLWEENK